MYFNVEFFSDSEVKRILDAPSEYIDSKKFFSWERFFTDLLVKKSNGTYLQYNKQSLNKAYLQEKAKQKILESLQVPGF